MSSISSLLADQLEAYGVPIQYASKVTGMFTGNIVALGLRLALVSLSASFVRHWFNHWKQILDQGEPMPNVMLSYLIISSFPHCPYRGRVKDVDLFVYCTRRQRSAAAQTFPAQMRQVQRLQYRQERQEGEARDEEYVCRGWLLWENTPDRR